MPSDGPVADFVLGLSVRRHFTGYALLRYEHLAPLQFGLVDVSKAKEMQQKALEIVAILRDLRRQAPEKLAEVAPSPSAHLPVDSGRWLVGIDDSPVDRSFARTARESTSQRLVAMLQGLVISDVKRLFRVAPILVHPRASRLRFAVRENGLEGRRKVFDIANEQVPDFPSVTHRSGRFSLDSLLISDAWATAHYTHRASLLAQKRSDPELVGVLREQILKAKRFRKMEQAIAELLPRRAGTELAEAMETRLRRAVDLHLHRMLDEEFEEQSARRAEAQRAEAASMEDADDMEDMEDVDSAFGASASAFGGRDQYNLENELHSADPGANDELFGRQGM